MNALVMIASIVNCYVGCGSGSPDKQALHVLECDTETGAAKLVQSVTGVQGTTFFQFDRAGKYLYSMISDPRDRKLPGKAVRFAMDGNRIGAMETLAQLPCTVPCHVMLSADGAQLAYAAYGAGTALTMPTAGGEPNAVVLSNEGAGPDKRRQQKAYAHFAFYTPDGSRLGIVNLGCDRIHFFDPKTMAEDKDMTVLSDPGDGPRHAVWSNDNRFLFVINELGNSVVSLAFDGRRFTRVGKWTMLPADFTGDSKASAIKLTKDGKILMATNRGHESVAFYDVDAATGKLALRNIAPLTGSFPRDFALMPGEKFMVMGHEHSNEVQIYRFDRGTCSLTAVGEPIKVWAPLCFQFKDGK